MTARLLDTDGPRFLDRYELIAELASGGMATVYLARLGGIAGFQRLVAIKHLHPHLEHDQQFVQMFLDEARLAAGIHHPYVVPILEVGASNVGHYLVMEYVEGDTLARLLARAMSSPDGKFPASVALRVMIHTLEGLHAAHELTDDFGRPLELVHRDVSPQNILVGVDGVGRITDFGVARALSRLTSTQAGQFKGKLAYMAPEQAQGGQMDRRTDVFAAGIVAWEALCMRRLFRGETDAETLNRVLFEPIPTIRDQDPSFPAAIDAVIGRALQRDPDARFATCLEFAEELERAAMSEGILSSVRDVAAYVQRLMGQDIAAQRDRVRAWLSRSEPSQAWPPAPPGGRMSLLGGAPSPPTSLSVASMSVAAGSAAVGDAHAGAAPAAPIPSHGSNRALLTASIVIAVAIVLSAVVVAVLKLGGTTPSSMAAVPPAPSSVASTTVSGSAAPSATSVSTASPATEPAIASAAPSASAVASAPAATKAEPRTNISAVHGGGGKTSVDVGGGKGSDDDLSTNPYR